jgi:hypothetical protein
MCWILKWILKYSIPSIYLTYIRWSIKKDFLKQRKRNHSLWPMTIRDDQTLKFQEYYYFIVNFLSFIFFSKKKKKKKKQTNKKKKKLLSKKFESSIKNHLSFILPKTKKNFFFFNRRWDQLIRSTNLIIFLL